MKKFNYMDPEMIMTVIVSLVVLAVGVFAFFVTSSELYSNNPYDAPGGIRETGRNETYYSWYNDTGNITNTGNSVFNIVGIVLVIGAIMTIVGLVYSYVKPGGY